MVTEQGAEAAGTDAAGADAVVLGACVEVLGRSPGNCTGISGATDDDVRAPTADPVDGPPIGPGEGEADAFEVGTFNGSEAQADPARALRANVSDDKQPAPFKLVPPGIGGDAAVGAGVAAAVGTALPGAGADGEFVCACAAPIAASHRIIAPANERCIAFSFLPDVTPGATMRLRGQRIWIGRVPRAAVEPEHGSGSRNQ